MKNITNSMKVEFINSINDLAFVKILCDKLRLRGLDATLYSFTSYKQYAKMKKRKPLIIRAYIHVAFSIITIYRMIRYNRVFIVSTNSILPSFLASIINPRKTIIWVYDIYPEAARISGKIRSGSFFSMILDWMFTRILNRPAACIYLGETLKIYAEHKYGRSNKSFVIPLGANLISKPLKPAKKPHGNGLHLMYIGNLGHMHDIQTLETYLAKLQRDEYFLPAPVHIRIAGYGIYREQIEKFAHEMTSKNRIHLEFEGYLTEAQLTKRMQEASLALVTLKAGAEKVCLPSKVYTALALNTPILAIAPHSSDLAQLVENNHFGWVVANGDTDFLHSKLRMLMDFPEELKNVAITIEKSSPEFVDFEHIANKWMEMFAGVFSPRVK